MAAIMGRTELGVREFGHNVTIPPDPKARLMYYIDCMCVLLDLSDTANLSRLRNYTTYQFLSEAETDALVSLCFVLSPDELNGKIIFQEDSMCGNSNNAFFEISAVQRNLLVSDSIIIGGQQRRVSKIMAYKEIWLTTNWINPMKYFAPRLARIAVGGAAVESAPSHPAIEYNPQEYTNASNYADDKDGCCCTIL